MVPPPVCGGVCVALPFRFLCCAFIVRLHPVSCVPNVASVSGLSIALFFLMFFQDHCLFQVKTPVLCSDVNRHNRTIDSKIIRFTRVISLQGESPLYANDLFYTNPDSKWLSL